MNRNQLEKLFEEHSDDRELAEAMAAQGWKVAQWVRWWGPILYQRNRGVFLPLIERWANVWSLRSSSTLGQWLPEVEANRDYRLYRVIYHALLINKTRGHDKAMKRWRDEWLEAWRDAPDRATRRDEMEKRDINFDIEDDFAAELYEIEPELTAEILIRRIDRSRWWDISYQKTAELARAAGDDALYFDLYRRTFPIKTWTADVLGLAKDIADPAELDRELERRHPEGTDQQIDIKTLVKLLEARGADVVPYLERRVPDIRTWGSNKAFQQLATAAREAGFTKLWSSTVSTQFREAELSAEVTRICDSSAPDWERVPQLLAIAGAKSGWGRWRWFTRLSPTAAVTLHDRFALLARTAFAPNLRIDAHTPYRKLAQAALDAGDIEMFDLLVARAAVVRAWRPDKLNWYAKYLEKLEPEEFARRATGILNLIEEPRVRGYGSLKRNPIHAVLFADPARYAPAIDSARDLLEASYELSRRIGLSMIASSGDAALAAANLDHLGSFILDEAGRETRIAAYDSLALAATHSLETATAVLERARAGLDLRRKRYPRDRLIRLIGQIIAAWPELRKPSEQPTVFERSA